MYKRKFTSLCISAITTFIFSGPVIAQSNTRDQSAETVEEIVVTGSRIRRSNLTTPTPVTTIDSGAVSISSANNIADLLRETPSVGLSGISSQNSNFDIQSSGLNTVNLRNLGESRTLVLVNGRRYVSGVPGSSAVDLNTIPTGLIERVDLITGGASAVYGSDAVAGVLNIITKQNFEGFALNTQYGVSSRGDSGKDKLTMTLGANFGDNKGNAVFHLARNTEDGLKSIDRGIRDLAYNINGNGELGSFTDPNPGSYGSSGRFAVDGGSAWTVNPDNSTRLFSWPADGYDRSLDRTISVPQERILFTGNIFYKLTDNTEIYTETMFSQVESHSKLEPFYFEDVSIFKDLANPGTQGIPISNPLIPAGMRADMLANGDN